MCHRVCNLTSISSDDVILEWCVVLSLSKLICSLDLSKITFILKISPQGRFGVAICQTETIDSRSWEWDPFAPDFLTATQLCSYENIIDEIQREYEKTQQLKLEIETMQNKLILSQLSGLKLHKKIAHINVKIFSDIVELFSLYRDEIKDDIYSFLNYKNHKFYMVEVFITNSLQQKLRSIEWLLWICVKGSSMSVCKTVEVKQLEFPIIQVLPVDQKIIDCELSASVILQPDESMTCLPLDSIHINISYHFEMSKKSKKIRNKPRNILEISKCFEPSLNIASFKPFCVEYNFSTKHNNKEFVKFFIQNCFHNVDLELYSELTNDTANNFVVKFSTGSQKHSVSFNTESRVVTLKSNVLDMARLKNYFINANTLEVGDGVILKKKLKALLSELYQNGDHSDMPEIYLKLRRVWAQ